MFFNKNASSGVKAPLVSDGTKEKILDSWMIWCPLWLALILYGVGGKFSDLLVKLATNETISKVLVSIYPSFALDRTEPAIRGGVSAFIFGFSAYALFLAWRKCAVKWNNWFPAITFCVKGALYFSTAVVIYLFLDALGHDLLSYPNILIALFSGFGLVVAEQIKGFSSSDEIRRGATVGSIKEVNSMTRKLPSEEFKKGLLLSKLKIPRSAEPYHFMVVGSTGSGKSVAITNIMDQIEARGDIALVVDSGGEFSSRYYRPERDALINPFDTRCAPWSPTAELEGPWDAESLAKSMVPDGTGDSKEWNSYAQTLVTAVLRKLSETKNLSIRSLLYYVQVAPIEELAPLLKGTAAAAQMSSDKTFGSIRTIATNYLATYSYLKDSDKPFSVANFIRKGNPGFLFFTYRDDQLDSLRNMISCALDIAARTILALPANKERRVWLIIDEFASIGKVQSIEAVATKARKMGGCLLLGLQSISQLKDRYGDNTAQTILSCLSSWLILRVSDADTSEYISKYIGEREISRMTRGTSKAAENSTSKNQQISNERAIMPSQLQRLANLQGFFKLAGDYPVCDIKLEFPVNRPKISENYATRDFVKEPLLNLESPNNTTAEVSGVIAPSAPTKDSPPLAITLTLENFPDSPEGATDDFDDELEDSDMALHRREAVQTSQRIRARQTSRSKSISEDQGEANEDWLNSVRISAVAEPNEPVTNLKGLAQNISQKRFE